MFSANDTIAILIELSIISPIICNGGKTGGGILFNIKKMIKIIFYKASLYKILPKWKHADYFHVICLIEFEQIRKQSSEYDLLSFCKKDIEKALI